MNPLGINLWNWENELNEACVPLVQKVAQMGFTAIELPMTQPEVSPDMATALQKSELPISLCAAMTAGKDLSSFEATQRTNAMDYLTRCLKTGEQLGASVLAGPLYTGGGKRHRLTATDQAREWHYAVTGLQELSRRARDCGIALALEPLNRYRSSVVNTVAQALNLVQDIGQDNVGIHFDTFHASLEEEDVLLAMKRVLQENRMFHFHACACNRGAPGQGHLPWAAIFTALKQYNYQNHITMETFAPGGLDSGWIQLGDTPDSLALQGLQYMKSQF